MTVAVCLVPATAGIPGASPVDLPVETPAAQPRTGTVASPVAVDPEPGADAEVEPTEPAPAPTTLAPTADPTPDPTATAQPTAEPTDRPQQTTEPGGGTEQQSEDGTTTAPAPTPSEQATTPATPEPSSTPTTGTVELPGWSTRPAVADSAVPWGMVVTALVVLLVVAAGFVWWWRHGGAERARVAATLRVRRATDDADAPTEVVPPVEVTGDRDEAHPAAGDATGVPTESLPAVDDTVAAQSQVIPATTPTPATAVATGALPLVAPTHHGEATAAIPEAGSEDDTVTFLVKLGEAMVDCSAPVAQVNSTLERVAAANDLAGTAIVTLPTALMVSVPHRGTMQTAVAAAGTRTMRLDQVADVHELARDAARGEVTPREGLPVLCRILSSPPPSSRWLRALGYVLTAAGLALVLGGGLLDVVLSALLGGVVAVVTTLTDRTSTVYQGLVVGACAFLVAVPVFLLVRTGWSIGLLAPLVAPLVTFLPGALLTTGVIDLATRQMIAGSSRLALGTMQLVLLALGITAAAGLVGVPATSIGSSGGQLLGWAAPWIGVLIYAVGVVLNNDARRSTLPWIALVLVVAYAGQVVGGVLFGASVSSFVGALVMTPVAMFAATRRSGPPFLVTFLPGFWVLVPGSLGLVGVTSALGAVTNQAITTIVTAGVSMVAISLGVLTGLALGSQVQRRVAPDVPPLV